MSEMRKIGPENFPPLLREIPDTPRSLYIQGELPDQNKYKYLAVVGSRKYSSYGKDACKQLIEGLCGYPVVIVSGLALGIDAIAHQAALDTGLTTIAVPGSGIDDRVLYPAINRNLARKILEKGGALLNEFDPMWKPRPESFPQRNRIMAGMSHATLVIEAEKKSGTLITARLAMDYNRDVLTVPGSMFSKTSEGPHYLIRNGATPVTSSKDILDALGLATDFTPRNFELEFKNCSIEERQILELLREPRPRDEVIRQVDLPASVVNAAISMLEIKGLVKEEVGEIRIIR